MSDSIQAEMGEVVVLESLCTACKDNGETRLLFTEIPHFRRIIVSSFECTHCGYTNREVQFGDEFPPDGVHLNLKVADRTDLNRQIVKSEHGVVTVPELDLEIPPQTQKGTINTVEGVMRAVIDGLMQNQEARRVDNPEAAAQIEAFITRVEGCLNLDIVWHIEIDDPSGNSNIEAMPSGDKNLTRTHYTRTNDQRMSIGLATEPTYNTQRTEEEQRLVDDGEMEEVLELPANCDSCYRPGKCKMHRCDIPFFKETIIMAFTCDFCGHRTSEVRSGGGIEDKGTRITLKVQNERDLVRDVLKSETSSVEIPEIDLMLTHGTLGGMFTTVEGLLMQIHDHLKGTAQTEFLSGDSALKPAKSQWEEFLQKLLDLRTGTQPFTLIFDDPVGSVYVQNPRAHLLPPDNIDPQLKVEKYTRTREQDDELGLLDMKTENYQDDVAVAAAEAAAAAAAATTTTTTTTEEPTAHEEQPQS
eukprot:PhM_4_TR17935/c0_g1_i1/m.13973/K06874/K06874; zinc finger protein